MHEAKIALIQQAIEQKRVLRFSYNLKARMVEPHILGYEKDGDLALSAYTLPAKGSERWRRFHVARIADLSLTGESFKGARPEYNPDDPTFVQVIARL